MSDWLKVGVWRHILRIPPMVGKRRVGALAERAKAEVGALSGQHRAVHHFVVRELPRVGQPLPPQLVAERLELPLARVVNILDELEAKKAFLFRNDQGAVVWAYPVTAAQTPHRLSFRSGERLYAAWAADALATPFVQGRLRNEELSVKVDTECRHCSEPLTLVIDSDMNIRVEETDAEPLVFIPDLVPFEVEGPSIVDDFWRENVFFWSEEHAREYRKSTHRIRGVYSPLNQVADANRIVQSAVFGFDITPERWPAMRHREPATESNAEEDPMPGMRTAEVPIGLLVSLVLVLYVGCTNGASSADPRDMLKGCWSAQLGRDGLSWDVGMHVSVDEGDLIASG